MNWLTKKKVLAITSVPALFFGIFVFLVQTGNCRVGTACKSVSYGLVSFGISEPLIVFFFALFIFAVVSLAMPISVFNAWRNFSVWSVPLVVLITILLSNVPNRGFFSGIGRAMTLSAMAGVFVLYALASLIIIIRAWLKTRKHHQQTP